MIDSNAFVLGLISIYLLVLPSQAFASAPPSPPVSDIRHDSAVVVSHSSCILYGPTTNLGFHAGDCEPATRGEYSVRLTGLAPDIEYFVRAKPPEDAMHNGEIVARFHTLPAFVCGDKRCERDRGENELLCPADCRIDRCDNTFGAYGFSIAKDNDIPEVAHRAGVRFSIGYTYPLQQMEIANSGPLRILQVDAAGHRIALLKQPGGAPFHSRPLVHPASFTIDGREYQCTSTGWWDAGGPYRYGGFEDCILPDQVASAPMQTIPKKDYQFDSMVQLNSRFTNKFQLREAMDLPLVKPGSDEIKVCSVQRKLSTGDLGNCQPLVRSPIGRFPAVFSIEWEEVSCTAFNPVDSKFIGCQRGVNHTVATEHPARTFLLDHKGLEEYLASIKDMRKLGYYVLDDPIDDSRSPNQSKSNYLPLLQKMYHIIKKADPVNPVFAGFPTLGLYMYPWKETVPRNIGLGAFDVAILYVYPGMRNLMDPSIRKDNGTDYGDDGFVALNDSERTTKAVVGRYMQVFEKNLGRRPPFIGVLRAFRMAPQWPENPTGDEILRQVDDFLDFGASAIAAYTLHSENPANVTPTSPFLLQRQSPNRGLKEGTKDAVEERPILRELLEDGAKYATAKLCPQGRVDAPQIELIMDSTVRLAGASASPPEGESRNSLIHPGEGAGVHSAPLSFAYSVTGSYDTYECALSIDGHEDRMEHGIASSTRNVVTLSKLPRVSIGVRCWVGSVQNSSVIRVDRNR